jgi:hypothetical protein
MPIYELQRDGIVALKTTRFGDHGLTERGDLQRLLRDKIEIVAPDTMVLAEEFGSFDESQRRIDLLAIDKDGNLIIVELKRTMTGGHMELQAIRYAAMVSAMTFDQAVEAHERYREQRSMDGDARQVILDFLEWEEPSEDEFAQDTRIVLVAADFSKEITTSVIWLNDREIDIRCVRLRPYELDGRFLMDVQQIIPLPEAAEYQILVREKARKERRERKTTREFTKFDVTVNGVTTCGLKKRRTALSLIRGLCEQGVNPEVIEERVPWRSNLWRSADGRHDSESFCRAVAADADAGGPAFRERRWFIADEELIYSGGRTWALSKAWSRRTAEALELMVKAFPEAKVAFQVSSLDESG